MDILLPVEMDDCKGVFSSRCSEWIFMDIQAFCRKNLSLYRTFKKKIKNTPRIKSGDIREVRMFIG